MEKLYYKDSYLKEVVSPISSLYEDNGNCCVQLEDEIFYPQGGGQKGDRGTLTIGNQHFKVINTIKDKYGESVLIVDPPIPQELQDSMVHTFLNWDFRYKQMRLHSCVHLHHIMLEKVAQKSIPNPQTSSIEDGFAFNRYNDYDFDTAIIEEANDRFLDIIKSDLRVFTYPDKEKKGFRWWECDGYRIPCGGVHINSLNEIGNVCISYTTKKKKITIKFTLTDD